MRLLNRIREHSDAGRRTTLLEPGRSGSRCLSQSVRCGSFIAAISASVVELLGFRLLDLRGGDLSGPCWWAKWGPSPPGVGNRVPVGGYRQEVVQVAGTGPRSQKGSCGRWTQQRSRAWGCTGTWWRGRRGVTRRHPCDRRDRGGRPLEPRARGDHRVGWADRLRRVRSRPLVRPAAARWCRSSRRPPGCSGDIGGRCVNKCHGLGCVVSYCDSVATTTGDRCLERQSPAAAGNHHARAFLQAPLGARPVPCDAPAARRRAAARRPPESRTWSPHYPAATRLTPHESVQPRNAEKPLDDPQPEQGDQHLDHPVCFRPCSYQVDSN